MCASPIVALALALFFFSVVSAFLFYYHLSHGRKLILSLSLPQSLFHSLIHCRSSNFLDRCRSGSERKKISHNMFRAYIKAVIRLMQNYINASKFCCLNFASSYHSFGDAGVCRNHWLDVLHFYFRFFFPIISLRSLEFSCRLIRPLLVLLLFFSSCTVYLLVCVRINALCSVY